MATWKNTDGFTDAQVAVLDNLSNDRYLSNSNYNWQNTFFKSQLPNLDVELLREMIYIVNYQKFNDGHPKQRTITITYDSNSDYTNQEKTWINGWKFTNRTQIGAAIAKAKRLSALSYSDQTIIDLLGESL
tara:strand:- start:397 stop:789 length:393 start_codon:yes stop_codon:yes gene_type:complete